MTSTLTSPHSPLLDPAAHASGAVHEVWRKMRDEQPVAYHPPSEYPAFWSVTRYEDVKRVYEQGDRFSSAHGVLLRPSAASSDPGAGLALALTDRPRHTHLRRALGPRFDVRCARALSDQLRADIHSVLASAAESAEFDFAHDVAGRLSSLLIGRLLGVPEADLDTVVRWIEEAFAAGNPMTSHSPLIRYVIDLMDERDRDAAAGRPGEDAVRQLMDAEIDGELLSETEVLLNCENLLGASENAGLSMAAGMLGFLEHPDAWLAVKGRPEGRQAAVEEVLRWASSATHSMRTSTEDSNIGGCSVPAGARVVLWVKSANRDERQFIDADRFDVARKPNRHLALGFGAHVCIGQTFARYQTGMLLDELATSVRSFEQTGPALPLPSIAVNGPARLPMRMSMR